MKDKFDTNKESRMKRREFLSSAAIPVVAALAPPSLFAQGSQSVASRAEGRVRVGIIGAGTVVREVMIPGFKKIQDCEVVAVANRSLQSSQRVADEFDIPRAYSSWQELLDDDGVDALYEVGYELACGGSISFQFNETMSVFMLKGEEENY